MKNNRLLILVGVLIAASVLAIYVNWPTTRHAGAASAASGLPPDAMEAQLHASLPRGDRLPSVASPRDMDDQALFAEILAAHQADVLVAPFSSPKMEGVDHVARWLAAWRLAALVADRTGLRVAEPVLTTRALGAYRRVIDEDDVLRLARRVGARWAVGAEVERRGQTMSLTLIVHTLESKGRAVKVIDGLAYDSAAGPETALVAAASVVPSMLGVPLRAFPAAMASTASTMELPADAADIGSAAPRSPAEAASWLQLLAAAMPLQSQRSRLLYAHSLVALDRSSTSAAPDKLAKARALLHLGRRPSALSLLEDPGSEAVALRAYADGDLVRLSEVLPRIKDSLPRLLASLEADELRRGYGLKGEQSRRHAELAKEFPAYSVLLATRLTDQEWFSDSTIDDVRRELERHQALLRGLSLPGVATRMDDAPLEVAAQIAKQRSPVWKANAAEWSKPDLTGRPSLADYFDVLLEVNRTAALKHAATTAREQDLPDEALTILSSLTPTFGRDSFLNVLEAQALYRIEAKEHKNDDNTPSRERAQRLARDALLWEGGFTPQALLAEQYVWQKNTPEYQDEPPLGVPKKPRPRRGAAPVDRVQVVETSIAGLMRSLPYDVGDDATMFQLQQLLKEAGRAPEFDRLVAQNPNRFRGSKWAGQYAVEVASRASPAAKITLLREQLNSNPSDWRVRHHLAYELLVAQKAAEARDVLLGDPAFKDNEQNPVETGNHAGEGADLLLSFGEVDRAKPLLKICADSETGSSYSFQCRGRLASQSGDFKEALRWAETDYERYRGTASASRLMQWAFLAGAPERAWALLADGNTLAKAGPYLAAALYGSRMAGESARQSVDRFAAWNPTDSTEDAALLRDRFSFQALFMDRAPTPDSMALLENVIKRHKDQKYRALAAGYVAFQRRDWKTLAREWGALIDLNKADPNKCDVGCFGLPYLALAHARFGSESLLAPLRDREERRAHDSMFLELVRAIEAAKAGNHDAAEGYLQAAFGARVYTGALPVLPDYLLLEVAEALNESYPHPQYKRYLADKAASMALRNRPAFAFSFIALYSEDQAARRDAIEQARRLDRASMHLAAALGKARR